MRDLYLNFTGIRRQLNLVIFYIGTILLIFILGNTVGNQYGITSISLLLFPLGASGIIQETSRSDDRSGYNKIQVVMPVTRKDIVSAKFLLGILYSLFNMIILFAITLLYVYGFETFSFHEGMFIYCISLIMNIFLLGVYYTSLLLLGFFRSLIVLFIVYFVGVSFFQIIHAYIVIRGMLPISYNIILIGFVIAILFLVLSYFITVKVYSRKEFH